MLFFLIQSISYGQLYNTWGDQENGTYHNPVLPADFSDLDVIRVEDDYYAISSTMQYSPGMVVLHSVDLVNWEIIGHVVQDLTQISPELNWDRMNRYGRGVWAGSIRYYQNKFWVYFGTPDEGFFMSSATNPAGPWEPIHPLWRVKGWDDCCSFLDDDGQLYFIATHFEKDPKNGKEYNIHLFKMTPDGKQLIMDTDTILYQYKGSEANKLYKINGLYYHYFSQVNTLGQRHIMMGRSNNILGPYEIKQLNKVDKIKDREPNQGGLLEISPGTWYFLTHHGRGDWEGRPASLLPVTWAEGWPIIGQVGSDGLGEMVWSGIKPIESKTKLSIRTMDDFAEKDLGHHWEWNYQPRADKFSLSERPGFLRLHAFEPIHPMQKDKVLLRVGNILTQRTVRTQQNLVTIKMDIQGMQDGQTAGLTHFSTENNSFIGIQQQGSERRIIHQLNGVEMNLGVCESSSIWLRSSWDLRGINTYEYSLNGKTFFSIQQTSQLTWGSYRGDRIGLFSYNLRGEKGYVDFDFVDYHWKK